MSFKKKKKYSRSLAAKSGFCLIVMLVSISIVGWIVSPERPVWVPTPGICTWLYLDEGLCRCNWVKMRSYYLLLSPNAVTCLLIRRRKLDTHIEMYAEGGAKWRWSRDWSGTSTSQGNTVTDANRQQNSERKVRALPREHGFCQHLISEFWPPH